MLADLITSIIISIAGDALIAAEHANPTVLVYHYGSFNQLFAWHNQGIGEM